MLKIKHKYDYFIDTTLLKCPWPILEVKKLTKKIIGKKILLKIRSKEFLIDIKAFLKNNKKIKVIYWWKEKGSLYIILLKNTEKEI